jgi:hypothetical protein
VARDGRVVIPRGKPGLGVDVLMDRVEAHVVKKSTHYAEAPTRGARTQ